MARTIKKGLDYFPFDVDFFQDIRIRKLIKYQGGKAITVYALLLCNIYRNGYYAEWDKELPFIISEQSGYTEAYIQEVIDCCLSIGLLSKDLFDCRHKRLQSAPRLWAERSEAFRPAVPCPRLCAGNSPSSWPERSEGFAASPELPRSCQALLSLHR